MSEQTETTRFQVRHCTWDWLPDWLVIDTEKEVRAAAYDDEAEARADCEARNQEARK